jgi:hypothetical protein
MARSQISELARTYQKQGFVRVNRLFTPDDVEKAQVAINEVLDTPEVNGSPAANEDARYYE